MSVFGRASLPAEDEGLDIADQRGVHDRTIRAQIADVSPDDGYVILNYADLPGTGRYATVPPLWASFPEVGGAAWGRFMPQRSDMVKVAFDFDDRPHVVGYDVSAAKPGVGDGRAGWPRINNLHKTAKQNPDAKVSVNRDGRQREVSIAKYAQFTPLNPGEFDFMSSGGAYIYGTNRGKLYMAGGSVSVSLIKNDLLLSSNAQLWSHTADNCTFRFGQVRRPDTNQLNTKIAVDPNGILKEFKVELRSTIMPGMTTNLATIQMGNIVDDAGVIVNSASGAAARYIYNSYNELGVKTFDYIVDAIGNWTVSGQLATQGVKFDFPVGPVTINSSAINLQGPMGVPPAINPLLLTTIYRPSEDKMVAQLSAQVAALSAALNALAGVVTGIIGTFQAAGVASSPPVPPPVAGTIIGKVLQAASAALAPTVPPIITASTAAATAATEAATTFVAAGQTYLSRISNTA